VLGFHLTFDLMHVPGLLGMPRRIYTYEPGRGWDTLNLLVSIGAFIQAVGILIFVANLILSYWKGARAGKDPWDAWTLEWSVSSPPTGVQFRVDSDGREPASALGSETPGRPRQPVRV